MGQSLDHNFATEGQIGEFNKLLRSLSSLDVAVLRKYMQYMAEPANAVEADQDNEDLGEGAPLEGPPAVPHLGV
jgi:hypothetical protein